MSLPRSEVTTDDAAGGDTLGFMSMIGSTLNLNGRQDSCHRPNSSNADGNDVLANIEDAASASSNSQAGGQEVELRDDIVSGGGGLSINRQFDSSSSDASSLPSNGVADANHRQDWRKGWVSICKPNWGSFVKAVGVGVVVACVYTIIHSKNVLISDLQTENSSLKKEQQYLLDISQLGSEQAQQGGGKKGKAGKDECCACLTSSPSTSPFPSESPTETESVQPSDRPSDDPSLSPSVQPSDKPSDKPSNDPSLSPSAQPSDKSSLEPSLTPSVQPSDKPSDDPSLTPSVQPSDKPSGDPSLSPSFQPSDKPSHDPSLSPSSIQPSSSPSLSCDAQITQRIIQRESLIALYDATNGDDWDNNAGWLSAPNECDWFGLTCNSGNIVTDIDLSENGLDGTIPSELGGLSQLEILSLEINQLSGPIPSAIASLSQLDYLNLRQNRLTGPIPTETGSLANLERLFLYDNQLSGTIPSELGGLSQLNLLYLSENQLSGTIPTELGGLSQLQFLTLYDNDLVGAIPDQVCALRPNPLSFLAADCSVCDNPSTTTDCCRICYN